MTRGAFPGPRPPFRLKSRPRPLMFSDKNRRAASLYGRGGWPPCPRRYNDITTKARRHKERLVESFRFSWCLRAFVVRIHFFKRNIGHARVQAWIVVVDLGRANPQLSGGSELNEKAAHQAIGGRPILICTEISASWILVGNCLRIGGQPWRVWRGRREPQKRRLHRFP